MKRFLLSVAAAAAAVVVLSTPEASARFYDRGLQGPTLVEEAACRVRRVRVVRPNGRVIRKVVRRCGPGIGRSVERCRVVRKRIVRPNGRVVVRSVRRCL